MRQAAAPSPGSLLEKAQKELSGLSSQFSTSPSPEINLQQPGDLSVGLIKLDSKANMREASKILALFLKAINEKILRPFYKSIFGNDTQDSDYSEFNASFQFKMTIPSQMTEDEARTLIRSFAKKTQRLMRFLRQTQALLNQHGQALFANPKNSDLDLHKLAFFRLLIENAFKSIDPKAMDEESDEAFLSKFIACIPSFKKQELTVRGQKIEFQLNHSKLVELLKAKTSPISTPSSPAPSKTPLSPPKTETELHSLKAQLTKAQEALTKDEATKTKMEKDIAALQTEKEGLTREKEALASKNKELLTETFQLKTKLKEAQEEFDSQINNASADIANKKRKLDKAEQRIKELEKLTEALKAALEASNEKNRASHRFTSDRHTGSPLTDNPRSFENTRSLNEKDLILEISQRGRKITELEEELDAKKQKLEALEKSLSSGYRREKAELDALDLIRKHKYKETIAQYYADQGFDDSEKFTAEEKKEILTPFSKRSHKEKGKEEASSPGKDLVKRFQENYLGELGRIYSDENTKLTLRENELESLLERNWEDTKKHYIDEPVARLKEAREQKRLSAIRDSEPPNTQQQLKDIQKLMWLAAKHYCKASFYGAPSLFHHHGETGRDRAVKEYLEFENITEEALDQFFCDRISGTKENSGNHYLQSWRTYQSLVLEEWQKMKKDPARRLREITQFSEFEAYKNLKNKTKKSWYWDRKKVTAEHLVRTLTNSGFFMDSKNKVDSTLERDNEAFKKLDRS